MLSQQVAGIGSRGLAALVDSLIAIIIILAMVFGALALSLVSVTAKALGPAVIAVVVVASVVPVLYYVAFEMATGGRSLGKLVFGLRVVDLDGVPVGLSDSLVRNLVRIVDFLPSFMESGSSRCSPEHNLAAWGTWQRARWSSTITGFVGYPPTHRPGFHRP